jgi:hypothetical protein
MALRKSVVFRRGPTAGAKANQGPQVDSSFVGSDRRNVQTYVRPGGSDSVDLACAIPATHTTTTISTAQHIEIAYYLAVRVSLEEQGDLVIDNIPVTMSNWAR